MSEREKLSATIGSGRLTPTERRQLGQLMKRRGLGLNATIRALIVEASSGGEPSDGAIWLARQASLQPRALRAAVALLEAAAERPELVALLEELARALAPDAPSPGWLEHVPRLQRRRAAAANQPVNT